MTPREKSEAAKRLMSEDVVKAAFVDIREHLVAQLEATGIGDTQTQHELALTLQILKRLQTQLHKYAQELTVAKYRQQQDAFIEKMKERV